MLLCKVDAGQVIHFLDVLHLKVCDHLERLHVAQVLVECEVSVHLEPHWLASVQNLSLVITGVGFLETFGLSFVSSIKDLMSEDINVDREHTTHLTSEL